LHNLQICAKYQKHCTFLDFIMIKLIALFIVQLKPNVVLFDNVISSDISPNFPFTEGFATVFV